MDEALQLDNLRHRSIRSSTSNKSTSSTMTDSPIKRLELYRTRSILSKDLEIRQNGKTILNTKEHRGIFKRPEINIELADRTIVASVRLQFRDALLHLGSPDCTDKADWIELTHDNALASKYRFVFDERCYAWTRTHSKELGASKLGNRDFKLVDEGTGEVLAVYRHRYAVFGSGVVADVDFCTELDHELELLSLVAILAIEEKITRRQCAASAGGGTAAGA